MSVPPEVAMRIKILMAEADGCIDSKISWEVGNNGFKRAENIEALRQQAIVLYARAKGLQERDWP